MSSVNKVTLLGNVGREPEVKHTASGDPIVNLSIATSESWKDKNSGEKKERTEWHRVVIFNRGLGEVVQKYVNKGDKIYIEGKLQTRKWQDQSGTDRYSTEVVLGQFDAKLVLLGGGKGGQRDERESYPQDETKRGSVVGAKTDLDDEIPF